MNKRKAEHVSFTARRNRHSTYDGLHRSSSSASAATHTSMEEEWAHNVERNIHQHPHYIVAQPRDRSRSPTMEHSTASSSHQAPAAGNDFMISWADDNLTPPTTTPPPPALPITPSGVAVTIGGWQCDGRYVYGSTIAALQTERKDSLHPLSYSM